MPNRLASRVAIITGASSGIGRAIALAYHREGASIVCADVRETTRAGPGESSAPTHEAITRDGGNAIFVKVDVGSAAEVEALVQRAVQVFGRLDIMVNNAGIAIEAHRPQPVWEMDEETWDQTMKINAKGVFLGCKYAAAQMVKQEPLESGCRGWIVNMASILGLRGSMMNGKCSDLSVLVLLIRVAASYCASKHAVVGLTRVVAMDCAPHRIHCNAICPGCKLSDPSLPVRIA